MISTEERTDITELDRLLKEMDIPITFGLSVKKRNQTARGVADGVPWPYIAAYVGWQPGTLSEYYQQEAHPVATLNPYSDLSHLYQFMFVGGR